MQGHGICRVYVSSTFRDLQRERGLILEAIERAGAKPASMEYYGADNRRALDLCVEDVKSCQLYIGLLGWRQGYCPAETPGIGITESEYRAAGERGIPRLLYLTPELATWQGERDPDTSAIAAFRERVKVEVTAFPFDSLEKLALAVSGDLGRVLGRAPAPEIPEDSLLPYLCDRVPQATGILDVLSADAGSPPVCLAHGDHNQSLSRFLDSLREVRLPDWVQSKYRATECRLDWPSDSPEKMALRIRQGLALALGCDPRGMTDQRLVERVAALPGPVLVSVRVPVDGWSAQQQARVQSFLEYFRQWPKRAPPKPDLVLLWAEYPPAQPGALGVFGIQSKSQRRYAEALRSVNALEKDGIVLLPAAQSVAATEAQDWARSKAVREAAPGRDLAQAVARLYQGKDSIPMEQLGPLLLSVLQQEPTALPRGGAANPHE
ncbi:MAG TPA: DUF4062 domain-containing protein [Polyangiaceae bacterium]|nr:DUF4062 domain-containing protein [Polyangiaceae bacterium]